VRRPDDTLGADPGPRPLALCGPTASGKTACALAIARVLPVEIISVDSALVYRGLDIGSAKPSPAERSAVPHHLIDIRDPWQPYSAAQFATDARRLIGEIHARGRRPLLVGGTMLYLKALADGLDPMPPADAALRAEIDAQAERDGWPTLHAALAVVDPVTAARLAPADSQRIQRALEVYRSTGRPLSDWRSGTSQASRVQTPVRLLSLEPQDRGWLHERIARRLDAMLTDGLLDEVRALRRDPRVQAAQPAMRAVGYRQCWEALDAADAAGGQAPNLPELRDRCIAATRQLAKRQLTWLRAWTDRTVLHADDSQVISRVLERADSHWSAP
jgi:tRNA dimethylallyltransferase